MADLAGRFVDLRAQLMDSPSRAPDLAPELASIVRTTYPEYSAAADLFEHGYAVVPYLSIEDAKTWRRDLRRYIKKDFPEYKEGAEYPVLGGFAALGNPSSFHHPGVREKRKAIYSHVREKVMKTYCIVTGTDMEDMRTELLFDRIMWRRRGQAASPEAWHRDVCAKPPASTLRKGDSILGGWTNLDAAPQYFSCVPGTHHDANLSDIVQSGFANIPKEDHPALKARSKLVRIPPGHVLCFFQHLVHEVVSTPASRDMFRMFHGFRFTTGTRSLFEADYRERRVFEDQALPRLPSFQLPPVYSKNHASSFLGIDGTEESNRLIGKFHVVKGVGQKTNLIEWSRATFKKEWIGPERVHGRTKRKYRIVDRYMDSLASRVNGDFKEGSLTSRENCKFVEGYPADEKALYAPALLFPEQEEEKEGSEEEEDDEGDITATSDEGQMETDEERTETDEERTETDEERTETDED